MFMEKRHDVHSTLARVAPFTLVDISINIPTQPSGLGSFAVISHALHNGYSHLIVSRFKKAIEICDIQYFAIFIPN